MHEEPANLCSRCGRLRNSLLRRGRVRRLVLSAEDLARRHHALRRRHHLRRSHGGAHRVHATRVPPESCFVAATAVSTSCTCCSCCGCWRLLLLLLCCKERTGWRQRLGRKAERQRGVFRAADEEGGTDPLGCGKEHSRGRILVALLGAWFYKLVSAADPDRGGASLHVSPPKCRKNE